MTEHSPHRPDFLCMQCGQPWPCAPAKMQLSEEYLGNTSSLTAYMGAHMHEAMTEAVRNHQWGRVDDLFERFVGWVRGGGSAA